MLIATNSPLEGPGYIGSALQHLNIKHDVVSSKARGDISRYSSFIMLGGPQSVNDDTEEIKKALKLVRDISDSGKPYLGICLGAQLIAGVLGGRVTPNREKEIGWSPVSLPEGASRSPVFQALPRQFLPFHWHGDTFDLPAGAALLASSEACRNQGFVIDDRVVGLQFHLETTLDSARALVKNCGHELDGSRYVQAADEILAPESRFARINEVMHSALRRLEQKGE